MIDVDRVRDHDRQANLDDLQFDAFFCLHAVKTVAHDRNDAIDQELLRIRRIDDVAEQVPVQEKFLGERRTFIGNGDVRVLPGDNRVRYRPCGSGLTCRRARREGSGLH